MTRLLSAFAALFALSAAACSQEVLEGAEPSAPPAPPVDRVAPANAVQMQLSFAPVVRQAAPAVVNVYSQRMVARRSPFVGDPFFEHLFGAPRQRERSVQSLGSGVIVDPSGVIVTNFHVVRGAQELRVVLSDRREFEAELLLADERTDLAVLKIKVDDVLPTLVLDDSGMTEVGDLVLAIGNPFGVGQTVTSGIISAQARTDVGITDYAFFIQTDAAVNPGNSGGALVDMDGELIGVNTAIFSRSGGSNGIGFAIPAEMVRAVVAAALEGGEIVRPWLAARLQPVTSDLAVSLGLERPRGAIVAELYPDGAAERAGLLQGDVLLAIDGGEINDENGARFRFATRRIGETAALTVLRDGRERVIEIAAEAAPGDIEGERLEVRGRNPLQGATLVELSPAFNEEVGIDPFLSGVMVFSASRRSAAHYFGFQPGDVVIEVADALIEDVPTLDAVLDAYEGANEWPFIIERSGERYAFTRRF
ncbi:MAG: Do family serine endopeptidase [Pseudomonadota bacterium]